MACCNECAQNQMTGLGEPTIPDYVVAGTVVEWGGYLRGPGGTSWGLDEGDLANTVEGCLYQSGAFSQVTATQLSGSINIYIGLSVTCANDFAHLVDVFNLITGQLYNCAGMTAETKAFRVAAVPYQAAGNPNVAQVGAGGNVNSQAVTAQSSGWTWPNWSLPNLSSNGAPSKNPIDSLASWLGVGQTEAAIIGAGLAVGAVFLLKRVL